jgi:hypothetical protein
MYAAFGLTFLRRWLATKRWEPLAALAIWGFTGLLMYTSNPLLWDFGFVPIAHVLLLLEGRQSAESQARASLPRCWGAAQ